MRSCKCTGHHLYACGCQWQWQVCQWLNGKCVCVSVRVCVCVSLHMLSFKLSAGYLFSPHYVNQGAVLKPTPKVTLYEPHTAEESLRRLRRGRHSQVLSGHAGQTRELLHVLLPPHQRTCVKWHLLRHSVHSWVSVIEKIPHGSVCVCKECIEKRKRWKSHTEVCVLMSDGCSPEAHACDLNKAHACDLNTVTTSMQCTDSKGKTNGYPKSRKEMQVQGGRWVWWRVCKVLGTSCCCKRVHFWKIMNTVHA